MANFNQNKLTLGTAQFGLNYGINNSVGKPSEKEVFKMLDSALEQGINSLETAIVYGNAIKLIGLFHQQGYNLFKIFCKFKNIKKNNLFDKARFTLDILKVPYFDVYSYHSFEEYKSKPYLIDELISLKENGLTKKIGISVYTNDEFRDAYLDKNIETIQIPYNLLDNDNCRGSYINLAKQYGKEIHARSVFLQGLFFIEEELFPEHLILLKPYVNEIKLLCKKENITIQALALSYAVFNDQIDQTLIGIENNNQLQNNLKSLINLEGLFKYINQHINLKDEKLLNPVNWE